MWAILNHVINVDDLDREGSSTTPVLVMDKLGHEVEEVLAHFYVKHGQMKLLYMVKWKDLPKEKIN